MVELGDSDTECAACLDSLVAKRACSEERIEHGKSLLVRVVSMLSKLVDRFSPATQVREDQVQYGIEDEDENENENGIRGVRRSDEKHHWSKADMQLPTLTPIILITLLAAAGTLSAAEVTAIKAPFTVYDVTFDRDELGRMPAALSAAVWEQAAAGAPAVFPLTAYSSVGFVTRTRTITLEEDKADMRRAACLAWSEGAHPHYGPTLVFAIPEAISRLGAEWLVSFDIAKGNVMKSGSVTLGGVGIMRFPEDGTVRFNNVTVARYAPARKLSFTFRVTVPDRKVAVFVDGAATPVETLDWASQERNLSGVGFSGLAPGGHAYAPSSLIVDNIRIVMVKELEPSGK